MIAAAVLAEVPFVPGVFPRAALMPFSGALPEPGSGVATEAYEPAGIDRSRQRGSPRPGDQ